MKKVLFLGLVGSMLNASARADVNSDMLNCMRDRNASTRLECFERIICDQTIQNQPEYSKYCEKKPDDVSARVIKIVSEHLGVDEKKLPKSASFIDDLGADSLDAIELVMAFEEEFNLAIPDDAAERINTVQDAINYITANQ